ncbi:hypothetical protein ABKN59_009196 [Abortiporus biennis]
MMLSDECSGNYLHPEIQLVQRINQTHTRTSRSIMDSQNYLLLSIYNGQSVELIMHHNCLHPPRHLPLRIVLLAVHMKGEGETTLVFDLNRNNLAWFRNIWLPSSSPRCHR